MDAIPCRDQWIVWRENSLFVFIHIQKKNNNIRKQTSAHYVDFWTKRVGPEVVWWETGKMKQWEMGSIWNAQNVNKRKKKMKISWILFRLMQSLPATQFVSIFIFVYLFLHFSRFSRIHYLFFVFFQFISFLFLFILFASFYIFLSCHRFFFVSFFVSYIIKYILLFFLLYILSFILSFHFFFIYIIIIPPVLIWFH